MGAVLGENMKRRIMAAVLALVMVSGIFGCGKKDDSTSAVKASKDYVYRLEDIDLGKLEEAVSYLEDMDDMAAIFMGMGIAGRRTGRITA